MRIGHSISGSYAAKAIAAAEAERDAAIARAEKAELALGVARLCVNCGKASPVSEITENGDRDECRDAEGLSGCSFDVTPTDAYRIWQTRYYEQRARAEKAEAERDRMRAALRAIYDWFINMEVEVEKLDPEEDAEYWLVEKMKEALWEEIK